MGIDRREFMRLAGIGGAVFASGLPGWVRAQGTAAQSAADFYFVQLSDMHWGFSDPKINPDFSGTLPKAVAAVNALPVQPDFAVFTGDLTHNTDDRIERRRRLGQVKAMAGALKVKDLRFMPGEHDAALDGGKAFRELFGDTHYAFDHKGVHFIALDNVSDPAARLGDEQLRWLAADLASRDRNAPIVVFTHRPLFDLAPQWDWATRDGAQALDLMMPFANLTVFYGHIHQENHHMTGHIAHHSAKSLMFALPAPLSQPKRAPVAWDPSVPYKGLGFREVDLEERGTKIAIEELPVVKGGAA
jgi:3',5'-cyclic AMP phosphodiesterase CpdA